MIQTNHQWRSRKPQTRSSKYASEPTKIASDLRNVDLSERRAQAAAAEKVRIEAERVARAKEEEEFETEESSEELGGEEEDDDDGSDQDSTNEDSSSEDEEPKVMIRPTFLRKDKRPDSSQMVDSKLDRVKWAEEEARRKIKANELIQEQLERNAAARAAGKKNWDDDEEENADDVDDADGLDPGAEYAAWKLRELKRVKRERLAIEEAEKEREEVERRRNLNSAERDAEDAAFIAAQKETQKDRGQMSYMQKYFHKGAFFQDDSKEQGLDRRDIMASKFEDTTDRSTLPEYMQIRDMTKLGKKGRTKYKDMKSEDTGKWGIYDVRKGRSDMNVDDRFKPDRNGGGGRDGPSGANAIKVQERSNALIGSSDGHKTDSKSTRLGPANEDSYKPIKDGYLHKRRPGSSSRSRSKSKSQSRSRSRSSSKLTFLRTSSPPRRKRQESMERGKRSPSPYSRYDNSKRRRVNASNGNDTP